MATTDTPADATIAADAPGTPARVTQHQIDTVLHDNDGQRVVLHDRQSPCNHAAHGIPTFVEFVEAAADERRRQIQIKRCGFCGDRIGEHPDDDTEPSAIGASNRQRIVGALQQEGEIDANTIGMVTGLNDQTMYSHLRGLIEDNVVEARRDPEDRRRRLYLLAGGDGDRQGVAGDGSNEEGDWADVERYEVVDAVHGAQSIHHVERELYPNLDRDAVEALLEELGYLDDLRRGGFNPDREAVIERVKEVVA